MTELWGQVECTVKLSEVIDYTSFEFKVGRDASMKTVSLEFGRVRFFYDPGTDDSSSTLRVEVSKSPKSEAGWESIPLGAFEGEKPTAWVHWRVIARRDKKMTDKPVREQFKVGDKVEWSSQAAGSTKTKLGTVVVVVPRGERAGMVGLNVVSEIVKNGGEKPVWSRCEKRFDGLPRAHESYLVHVPTKSGRGKGQLYWPRVSQLRLA